MYLAIKDVKPQDDYRLLLTFENDEIKDGVRPYLSNKT